MNNRIYCTRVCEEFSIDEPCCISCHEDDEEFGYPLCEVDLPDGRISEVCCRVMEELKKKLS